MTPDPNEAVEFTTTPPEFMPSKPRGRPPGSGKKPPEAKRYPRAMGKDGFGTVDHPEWLPTDEDHHFKKICGAKKTSNKGNPDSNKCYLPAGWGTSHRGYGRCKRHGGATINGGISAEKEMVLERMATFGTPLDIGPHEALLLEVQRTAGHVQWLGERIRQMEAEELAVVMGKTGMKISEWLILYQNERKMLVSVCNVAIKAGVAERKIRLAEEQGKMIALIFHQLINDERLGLNQAQRWEAPKIVGQLLRELPVDVKSTIVEDPEGKAIFDDDDFNGNPSSG